MVQRQQLGFQVYMDAETTATLAPVPSARHLLSQHRRWLGGGIGQGWAYAFSLLLAIGWALGLLLYILFGWMLGWLYWVAFLAAKAVIDASILRHQQTRIRQTQHARFWWVPATLSCRTDRPVAVVIPVHAANRLDGRDGYSVEYS